MTGGGIGARLLSILGSRTVVTPSLRKLIEALPDDPATSPAQAEAVAGLIVLNAWICCGPSALDLLHDMDQATESVLGLFPRDVVRTMTSSDDCARARAEILSLATKLGFSPARRMKVANAVSDCAAALGTESPCVRLDVKVMLHKRGLAVDVADLGTSKPPGPHEIGSGRWLGLHRLKAVADELKAETGPDERPRIRAVFLAGEPQKAEAP